MTSKIYISLSILFTIISASFYSFTDHSISDPETNYKTYCSGCHGEKMQAFVDRKWKYGSSNEEIAKSIKEGYPDDGMSSYDTTFTDTELDELVSYIQKGITERRSYNFDGVVDENTVFSDGGEDVKLELISSAADIPWGMTFLPDGGMLIADRDGELYRRYNDGREHEISNVPEVVARGQGGLMDVELHPEYSSNQIIYLSYSKPNPEGEGQTTAIYMAQLDGNNLMDGKDIFIAIPYLKTRHHYGSRIEFGQDGKLYFTVGDRGRRDDNPQFLDNACGKVHRINDDGSIPQDNPFIGQGDALPSIWSYGHRNPQGLTLNSKDGTLWSNEHGPRGGDEINKIEKGLNYGWPVISYGINYNGTTFTNETHKDGMEQPIDYWIPSIGVCGMAYIDSDKYPAWDGGLLSGSLRFDYVHFTKVQDDKVISEEKLLPNIGRLRSVEVSPDGYIYIGVEDPGRIYKVVPVSE